MSKRLVTGKHLGKSVAAAIRPIGQSQARAFSACTRCRTDGVYQELTAMRTRTPFIEAFRKQQEPQGQKDAALASSEKVERDLSPKSMSESYHKVVSEMIVKMQD